MTDDEPSSDGIRSGAVGGSLVPHGGHGDLEGHLEGLSVICRLCMVFSIFFLDDLRVARTSSHTLAVTTSQPQPRRKYKLINCTTISQNRKVSDCPNYSQVKVGLFKGK